MTDNVKKANKYAKDIVSGKIPACRLVIKACQRHLDDLDNQKDKDFPYRFDEKPGGCHQWYQRGRWCGSLLELFFKES